MNLPCSGNQNYLFFVNIFFVKKLSGHAVSKPLWIISNLVISLVPYLKATKNYNCVHNLIGDFKNILIYY